MRGSAVVTPRPSNATIPTETSRPTVSHRSDGASTDPGSSDAGLPVFGGVLVGRI